MIYKRHLFTLGAFSTDLEDTDKDTEKMTLSMGEDEKWEALTSEGKNSRTWWRKWLKIK